VYFKSGASAQKQIKPEMSPKEKTVNRGIQGIVNVGDSTKCPECETIGRVVWISEDKKRMGVRCHASHGEARRPGSKFGGTLILSTKTKKNVVFLTSVR
jgi:hypothetical protein